MSAILGKRLSVERGVEAAAIVRADWLATLLYGAPRVAAAASVCPRMPFAIVPRFADYRAVCASVRGAVCVRRRPRGPRRAARVD